jgi:hypothetical protein
MFGLYRELLEGLKRLRSGRYWWVWRLLQVLALIVGVFGVVRALFLGMDLYYRHFAGFTIRFSDRADVFEILETVERDLNERSGSAEVQIPLVLRNLGEKPIKLDQAEGSLEVRMFKYFVGTRKLEEWFKYKISFDEDDARFRSSQSNKDLSRKPSFERDFEGELALGGNRGNFPRIRVDPSEKAIMNYLERKQSTLRPRLYEEEEKHRKDFDQKIERAFTEGRPTGWLRSPRVTAREALRDQMVLYCDIQMKRAVTMGRSENSIVREAQDDKDVVRVTLWVQLTDTTGKKAESELAFAADCHFNEEFMFWVRNYPVKGLGYGRWGERIMR